MTNTLTKEYILGILNHIKEHGDAEGSFFDMIEEYIANSQPIKSPSKWEEIKQNFILLHRNLYKEDLTMFQNYIRITDFFKPYFIAYEQKNKDLEEKLNHLKNIL